MKRSIRKVIFLLAGSALLLATGCNKDDDDHGDEHEHELITTLIATFTPQGGGTAIEMKFYDPDGDGPTAPEITVDGPLNSSTTYDVSLQLLNENESEDMGDPHYNVNLEIQAEDDHHQFFFEPSNGGFTLEFDSYEDFDGNSNPLGLETVFSTGAASSGTLTITLLHEPDKNATNVSDGDMTNAGGEIDLEVTFNVDIEDPTL